MSAHAEARFLYGVEVDTSLGFEPRPAAAAEAGIYAMHDIARGLDDELRRVEMQSPHAAACVTPNDDKNFLTP